jgi:hypothetical protein
MSNATIKLEIRGFHPTSFKNSKMMCRGRLITDPKKQKQMEQIIQDFVSQLISSTPTTAAETWTEAQQLCWIASSTPADDSYQWIPEIHLLARRVEKGDEGANITIERL